MDDERTDRDEPQDGLDGWIEDGTGPHPSPESERHATDDAIREIHQRLETDSVEALLELVGHEIRTPLAVIKGTARMLLEDEARLEPDQVEAVHRIVRNGSLVTLLIDRLAEVRSVDAGTVVLHPRPLDIVAYVRETVDLLHESVLGARPVDIHTDGDTSAVCEADPRRLQQIMFNLLANAALNTPTGAPINITVREAADGGCEIEVRDDGHGVAPDDVDELFEKFPRLEAARQGPGVGLYVSRGLARAHGGELEAVPAEEDEGGIFVLRLPGERTDEPG